MLISLDSLVAKYKLKITGLLQVGAHFAEEHNDFLKHGVNKFVYVEPAKDASSYLVNKFEGDDSVWIFKFAAGASDFKTEMFVEKDNQGQSNSLLPPKEHLIQHPSIRFTEKEEIEVHPLNQIYPVTVNCNFLMVDTQGYELEVLKGATQIIPNLDYIYLEVNRTQVYEGCPHVDEIDSFLAPFGFDRMETVWVGGWGDAYYQRNKS